MSSRMIAARPHRPIVLVVASVALLATGCAAADDEEPAGTPSPVGTGASTAPDTSEAEADAVAAITTVFEDYWDAVIASENGPDPDPALFEGIATGSAVQTQLTNVDSLKRDGIRRIGEPTLGEPVITVDGETATVEVCVDDSAWGAAIGDATAPPVEADPWPSVVALELVDGDWLVTEQVPSGEATITC